MADYKVNELKHYLDQAGLTLVWSKIDALFARKAQLETYVTEEELAAALANYYTKTEVDNLLNVIRASVTAEETRAKAEEAKKVDKEITSASGKSLIFNEADGGGAKFEHTDGSESFVGVNDGGKNGLMAQIYADQLVGGKWQGAKLDVYNDGIYYTVGNQSATERKNADNELVVKKDIKDLAGGMHFIGVVTLGTGETIEQAIQRCYTEQGKVYADRKAGDLVIVKTADSDKEFICDNNKEWVELGDQGLYATKAELASEASTRSDADAVLQAGIEAEAATRATEDAKKVDKEIVTAGVGKAIIFNEADGGGAKYEKADGTASFVGVNQDTNGGIGAQLYDIDVAANKGSKVDVTKNGVFYTKGDTSALPAAQRDVAANEIAVKGDISAATQDLDAKIAAEETRATAAEAALQAGKLDVMPGDEYTAGNAYNLPYFFETTADATKATVTAHTVTLDGNKTHGQYSLDVVSATTTVAGLMSAADKDKLDGIGTLTQQEIEDICK